MSIHELKEEDPIDLGACCSCGQEGPMVCNVIMLARKALEPGSSWNCFVCKPDGQGAIAVVCDECLQKRKEIKFAVVGYVAEKRRIPIEQLTEPFDHNMKLHKADKRDRTKSAALWN